MWMVNSPTVQVFDRVTKNLDFLPTFFIDTKKQAKSEGKLSPSKDLLLLCAPQIFRPSDSTECSGSYIKRKFMYYSTISEHKYSGQRITIIVKVVFVWTQDCCSVM